MKPLLKVLVCCGLAAAGAAAATSSPATRVAPKGTTVVSHRGPGRRVEVIIKTHEVSIGKPSAPWPAERDTSCTYSRYPCSLVDRIEVVLDGKALFVPRSVFADLADLNTAEITPAPDGMTLVLVGGDASEAYTLRVDFDAGGIERRVLFSSVAGGQALQETIYHRVTVGE